MARRKTPSERYADQVLKDETTAYKKATGAFVDSPYVGHAALDPLRESRRNIARTHERIQKSKAKVRAIRSKKGANG